MVTHLKHISLFSFPELTSIRKSSIMHTIKLVIICSLFLAMSFCTTNSFAQLTIEIDNTTRFENLSVDQGLSSRYNTCIHQDSYGFVWIGTQNGLNLYDGMDFTIFRSQDNNPNSLPDNYIYKILEDKDSTLWICSEYGLSRYNRASEDFTNFYPDSINFYNPINTIREICELNGNLMLDAGGFFINSIYRHILLLTWG